MVRRGLVRIVRRGWVYLLERGKMGREFEEMLMLVGGWVVVSGRARWWRVGW